MGSVLLAVFFLPVLVFAVVAALLIIANSVLLRSSRPGPQSDMPSLGPRSCPRCGRTLQDDWLVCPYDNTRIR
jgi:hypothetical protein